MLIAQGPKRARPPATPCGIKQLILPAAWQTFLIATWEVKQTAESGTDKGSKLIRGTGRRCCPGRP